MNLKPSSRVIASRVVKIFQSLIGQPKNPKIQKKRCWLFGEKSCVGKCPHMTKKHLRALPKYQMKAAKHFYCRPESSRVPRGASDHENPDF